MKSAFLLSLSCMALLAQQSTLEPLEIRSSIVTQDELHATDAVEIFTADQIALSGAVDLYDFLNTYTSLIAMPSFGNPFSQRIDMHGYGMANGYQNIVINVNGRRLNNIDLNAPLLASISPSMIERIEIIKGGGSVSAGDGANAGTINIITKRAADNTLTLYGGVYNTYDATLSLGHQSDTLAISALVEGYHTDGTRHINAAQDRDAQQLANGMLDLSWTPIEALELFFNTQFHRSSVHYGGPMSLTEYKAKPSQPGSGYGYGPAPVNQRFKSESIGGGFDYTFGDGWHLRSELNREKKTSEYVEYASRYDYDYDSFNTVLGYENGAIDLNLGAEGFLGERHSSGERTSKDNLALFAITQWIFGSSRLKAGIRGEQVAYTHKGAQELDEDHTLWSAEAGYNYQLSDAASVFLNYAHSFEAADIDRFFSKDYTSGVVSFNGFIDPMHADTFTLGYSRFDPQNTFKFSLYYAALQDEIYYYSDPAYTASMNTNIDKSHKYGMDIYDTYAPFERLHVTLNYNYVKAIIDDEIQNAETFSDHDLPGVPEHTIKASLTLTPTPKTTFTLTQIWRSETYSANDFANNFEQKQEVYNSTDVAINYREANYELFAKISNLFNESNGLWITDDAIYPVNFTTTAIAGMSLHF